MVELSRCDDRIVAWWARLRRLLDALNTFGDVGGARL
jgi:hypothetical protein